MDFYLVPRWFFGFDIVLELIFAGVTLLVAVYALYMYKLSAEKDCKLLGFGFTSISLAYVVWGLLNYFLLTRLSDSRFVLIVDKLSFLGFVILYGHIVLMLLGLATLSYMTFKTRSYRAYSLFVSLPLVLVLFSKVPAVAYYFASSMLLFYVMLHYLIKYNSAKRPTTLFVMLGFTFLFLGSLAFTFAVLEYSSYVAGHLLQFVGYLLILIGFIKTVRS